MMVSICVLFPLSSMQFGKSIKKYALFGMLSCGYTHCLKIKLSASEGRCIIRGVARRSPLSLALPLGSSHLLLPTMRSRDQWPQHR